MKIRNTVIFCYLLFLSLTVSGKEAKQPLELWYEQPATEWMKALPLGNGRLGAMVYGGTTEETIALNELTLWSGKPDQKQNKDCGAEKLAEIRKLFFSDKYKEGHDMADQYLTGDMSSFGTHLPLGDLKFKFIHSRRIKEYRRSLDISRSVVDISYMAGDTLYARQLFCSNPADVLVMRINANKKKAVSFDLALNLLLHSKITATKNGLTITGKTVNPDKGDGGVDFFGTIHLEVKDGIMTTEGSNLKVRNADEVTLYFDINSNYKLNDPRQVTSNHINKAVSTSYSGLLSRHIKDYRELFDRVSISIGDDKSTIPTDDRKSRLKEGEEDVALSALFLQYGRYLVISSSRENSPLPSNLQGVWNDNLACNMGWNCDYHLDINTQQNYWANNICNLAECNTPLFSYIGLLATTGAVTARKVFGADGWTAHTVANCWGYTAPGSSVYWGMFPTAGTWIASHLSSHYDFTQDKAFLQKTAYPLLRGNARFLLDYMITDPSSGYLMSGPSISPENAFRKESNQYGLSMMPTCDRELVFELFNSLIKASQVLGVDSAFRDSLQQAIAKLPPLKVGSRGQLQEWFYDFEEAVPNHRHTSHLLALYPFNQISPVNTPDLAKASAVTINNRLSAKGWEDVEFSRANMISLYARLLDAENAYKSVKMLITDFSRENLFTMSPKGIAGAEWDIFVVDGNTAGAAGIAEMLIQSHNGYIEFLPCLPSQWKKGHYKGLCVRGGAEAEVKWENAKIQYGSLKATANNCFIVKLPAGKYQLTRNGKKIASQKTKESTVSVEMKKGDLLEINNVNTNI